MILDMRKELGVDLPSKEQIDAYVRKTLNEGRWCRVMACGLRKTDPGYRANEFGKKHMPDDPWCRRCGIYMKRCRLFSSHWGRSRIPGRMWMRIVVRAGALWDGGV